MVKLAHLAYISLLGVAFGGCIDGDVGRTSYFLFVQKSEIDPIDYTIWDNILPEERPDEIIPMFREAYLEPKGSVRKLTFERQNALQHFIDDLIINESDGRTYIKFDSSYFIIGIDALLPHS